MAWNEARVNLIGKHFVVRTDVEAQFDADGRLVSPSVVSFVPDTEAHAENFTPLSGIAEWLVGIGFQRTGDSDESHNAEFTKDDVTLTCFFDEPNNVGHIELQFGLSCDSYQSLNDWILLAERVCKHWGFNVQHPRRGVLDCSEFAAVLSDTMAWREFSDANDWPSA